MTSGHITGWVVGFWVFSDRRLLLLLGVGEVRREGYFAMSTLLTHAVEKPWNAEKV